MLPILHGLITPPVGAPFPTSGLMAMADSTNDKIYIHDMNNSFNYLGEVNDDGSQNRYAFAFHPTQPKFARGYYDGVDYRVVVYNIDNADPELWSVDTDFAVAGQTNALIFSPNGAELVVVCGFSSVIVTPNITVYDASSWATVTSFDTNNYPPISRSTADPTIAFSPDGLEFALGTRLSPDYEVEFYETTGWTFDRAVVGTFVGSVAYSPDGSLYTHTDLSTADTKVRLTATDAENVPQPTPMFSDIYTASFSPNGNFYAIGGLISGGIVRVYDTTTWNLVASLTIAGTNRGYSVGFTPDSSHLCVACGTQTGAAGRMRVFETTTWTETNNFTGIAGRKLAFQQYDNSPYVANGVTFGGTTNLSDLAATGKPDNKLITVCQFINNPGTADHEKIIHTEKAAGGANVASWELSTTPLGCLRLRAYNTAGAVILEVRTTGAVAAGDHAVQVSADLSNVAKRHFYIDDAPVAATWATYTDDTICWSEIGKAFIGVNASGTNQLSASIGEVYMNNTYHDFSIEAERRKFVTADGTPAKRDYDGSYLGDDKPLLWLTGQTGSWNNNRGSMNGSFVINNGPLTTYSGLPWST